MINTDFYRTYPKADLKILLKYAKQDEEKAWQKYSEIKDKVEMLERLILEAE